MSRGNSQAQTASAQGNANATQAANNSQDFLNNSNALYSTVAPQLTSEAANPAGFDPTDLAAMNTDAQQSAGGSQAAAVGQGALLGARTRNSGAAASAIGEAAREGGQQLSKNALGVQRANAGLKESQRQSALGGLENLTGLETGAANNALGVSNGALSSVASNAQANTAAENASYDWASQIMDPLLSAAGGAASGAAITKYCWIAEAVYGVDDWRTHVVRAWLSGPFRETSIGSLVMALYLKFGQRVAAVVRRSSLMRMAFKPLFDLALRKALK
jgi:hypothetical protein